MVNFSSIPSHLQVRIGEKIDFRDLKEMEISSKLGREVGKCSTFNAVLRLDQLSTDSQDIYFFEPGRRWCQKSWKWCTRDLELSEIPRLAVSTMTIHGTVPPNTLIDLEEKVRLVNGKMELLWENSKEDKIRMLTTTGQIINIARFFSELMSLERDLAPLSEFGEILEINYDASGVPDDMLLLLKSRIIRLQETADISRIDATANLFLQQWFQKKRDIQCFIMRSDVRQQGAGWGAPIIASRMVETLLFGVPNNIVWRYNPSMEHHVTHQSYPAYIVNIYPVWKTYCEEHRLHHGDVAYSIERRDKKLLVLSSSSRVIAQEYTDLNDVITVVNRSYREKVEENKNPMKRLKRADMPTFLQDNPASSKSSSNK